MKVKSPQGVEIVGAQQPGPQVIQPDWQTHAPPTHVPLLQRTPPLTSPVIQPPQLFGSVAVSTQTPLQTVLVHSHTPLLQA